MSDLIRREDVAKTIQHICDLCGEQKKYNGVMCGSCYLDTFVLDDIPSAEPERKWIPVTESLPEVGQRVLITHKAGVSFGWHNGRYFERGAPTYHRKLETVVAWMPLPEPWRGDR